MVFGVVSSFKCFVLYLKDEERQSAKVFHRTCYRLFYNVAAENCGHKNITAKEIHTSFWTAAIIWYSYRVN